MLKVVFFYLFIFFISFAYFINNLNKEMDKKNNITIGVIDDNNIQNNIFKKDNAYSNDKEYFFKKVDTKFEMPKILVKEYNVFDLPFNEIKNKRRELMSPEEIFKKIDDGFFVEHKVYRKYFNKVDMFSKKYMENGYHIGVTRMVNDGVSDVVISPEPFEDKRGKNCIVSGWWIPEGVGITHFYTKNSFYEGYCVCYSGGCRIDRL